MPIIKDIKLVAFRGQDDELLVKHYEEELMKYALEGYALHGTPVCLPGREWYSAVTFQIMVLYEESESQIETEQEQPTLLGDLDL